MTTTTRDPDVEAYMAIWNHISPAGRHLNPADREFAFGVLDALHDGWRPVADCRAANPEERPENAVTLMARGPRLAWLMRSGELSTGRAS